LKYRIVTAMPQVGPMECREGMPEVLRRDGGLSLRRRPSMASPQVGRVLVGKTLTNLAPQHQGGKTCTEQ